MARNEPQPGGRRKVFVQKTRGNQTHPRYVGYIDPSRPDELQLRHHADGEHHVLHLQELFPEVYLDHEMISSAARDWPVGDCSPAAVRQFLRECLEHRDQIRSSLSGPTCPDRTETADGSCDRSGARKSKRA